MGIFTTFLLLYTGMAIFMFLMLIANTEIEDDKRQYIVFFILCYSFGPLVLYAMFLGIASAFKNTKIKFNGETTKYVVSEVVDFWRGISRVP